MASKKHDSNEKAVAVAPVQVALRPVKISAPEETSIEVSGLPAEWQAAESLAGFPPSPAFENPGEALFGIYVGMRSNVGPNSTRLYEIMAIQGIDKKAELTAVWGSTALDRMFDSAYPPIKSGDKIGIIYIGEKETKRKQNPVKLFNLKVLRPGAKTETMANTGKREPENVTPK